MTTDFLEELVHSPNLLPAEHKAAAQLLQMMGTTKKDESKADVDLDILLAPHMVSISRHMHMKNSVLYRRYRVTHKLTCRVPFGPRDFTNGGKVTVASIHRKWHVSCRVILYVQ